MAFSMCFSLPLLLSSVRTSVHLAHWALAGLQTVLCLLGPLSPSQTHLDTGHERCPTTGHVCPVNDQPHWQRAHQRQSQHNTAHFKQTPVTPQPTEKTDIHTCQESGLGFDRERERKGICRNPLFMTWAQGFCFWSAF